MSKIPNFEMLNFEKQRTVSDAECHQESNGAIYLFFSVRGLEPSKNHVWLYDVTNRHHVVEKNSFWGSKIDVSIWNFVL